MLLRPEEELAARSIQTYLTSRGRHATWSPGDPDPPDLIFEVDGERWGVEITRLFQYFNDDGTARSREAVAKPFSKMCNGLQAYAAAKAPNMGFSLVAMGPTRPSISTIEKRGKDFVDNPTAGKARIDDRGRVTIELTTRWQGLRYAHGLVSGSRTASGTKLSADIRQNVHDALKKAADDKEPRLAKIVGYDRKVLALVNDYFFATPDNVAEVYQTLRSPAFDAVLFVDGGSTHVIDDLGGLFPAAKRRRRFVVGMIAACLLVAAGCWLTAAVRQRRRS